MKKMSVKVSQISTFSIIWVRAASKLVCAAIVNVFVRFIRALVWAKSDPLCQCYGYLRPNRLKIKLAVLKDSILLERLN